MTVTKKVTTKQTVKSDIAKKSPETTTKTEVKPDTPSKASRAMKIMEEQWDNIQSGKIKRKDIIQRFIKEVGLTPKGASTYFRNCKKKLTPNQLKN